MSDLPTLHWENKATVIDLQPGQPLVCVEQHAARAATSLNRLIQGDNAGVMRALLPELAGSFDLIYADPPFMTSSRFEVPALVGPSLAAEPVTAYGDRWRPSSYLSMLYERIVLMRELLSPRGSLYLHCDWRTSAWVRLLLDEVFGADRHVNEIIWSYRSGGASPRRFARKHDTIFLYAKGPMPIFNRQLEKSYNRGLKPYRFRGVPEHLDEHGWHTTVTRRDVWEIDMVGRTSSERLGYATQKPAALLETIVAASSDAGSMVGDFFCGSGTTLAVASRMGRRWIGCDASFLAIHTSRARLLDQGDCSFAVERLDRVATGGGELQARVECNGAGRRVRLRRYRPAGRPASLDWVCYWAVDWDFDGQFHAGWSASRLRARAPLPLVSPWRNGGTRIAVRVADALGNERQIEASMA